MISFLSISPIFSEELLIVDPHLSPYAGGYDILAIHWTLTSAEDLLRSAPNRDSRALIWGRTIEQAAWYVINGLCSVTQHEFFGHGYRLRELHTPPISYQITPFSGATAFQIDARFPVGNLLAVTVAGLEAESLLARQVKWNCMQTATIDGRLSSLYTQCAQSIFWYTLITKLGELSFPEEEDFGNDVTLYRFLLNRSYPSERVSLSTLLKWTAFNWLDPMTFYAYFSFFHYIFSGSPTEFPTIPIRDDIRYLPNIKIGYAPYAPEAYLENFFLIRNNPLYVYLKGGERSLGCGLAYDHLFHRGKLSLGIRFDGWRQGRFVTSATVGDLEEGLSIASPQLQERIWGGALSLVSRYDLGTHIGLFAELGGKTKGYLPGYSIGGGIVVRGGFMIGKSFQKNG